MNNTNYFQNYTKYQLSKWVVWSKIVMSLIITGCNGIFHRVNPILSLEN